MLSQDPSLVSAAISFLDVYGGGDSGDDDTGSSPPVSQTQIGTNLQWDAAGTRIAVKGEYNVTVLGRRAAHSASTAGGGDGVGGSGDGSGAVGGDFIPVGAPINASSMPGMAFSGDGAAVAVHKVDGKVSIFRLVTSEWVETASFPLYTGASLTLNHDGTRLAGQCGNATTAIGVCIDSFSAAHSVWRRTFIASSNPDSLEFATSVAFNGDDATVLAVSDVTAGFVYVYQLSTVAAASTTTSSTAASASAIASATSDGILSSSIGGSGGESSRIRRVPFRATEESWSALGDPIYTTMLNVAISADGARVAGGDSYVVRCYQWSSIATVSGGRVVTWSQVGGDIGLNERNPDIHAHFGNTVAMSADGMLLAMSNYGGYVKNGQVLVYYLENTISDSKNSGGRSGGGDVSSNSGTGNSGDWEQVGETLYGLHAASLYGTSVALTSTLGEKGLTLYLAVGAPYSSGSPDGVGELLSRGKILCCICLRLNTTK